MTVITDKLKGKSSNVKGEANFQDFPGAYISLEECFLYEEADGSQTLNNESFIILGESSPELY